MPFLTSLLETHVILMCHDTRIANLFISSVIPRVSSADLETLSIYVPPLIAGLQEERRLIWALQRNLRQTPVRMGNGMAGDGACAYGIYERSWV
jgi:hypothetical protein